MDEAGLNGVGRDLRARTDDTLVHDDGIALRVAGALIVAADVGVEHLAGVILGDGAGDDVCAGVIAVEIDGEVRLRMLVTMGHDLFLDDERGTVRQVGLRVAIGGVDTLDLGRLHLHVGVLAEVNDRRRVHDILAVAVALAVVLFDVAHLGILADKEAVDAVMAGLLRAAVVDAAAGDDGHIAVLTDVKVIVDHVLEAGLGNDDRDVHALVFRAGGNVDVNAGLVFLRDDVDVRGRIAPGELAVGADVIGTLGDAVEVGDLFEQFFLNRIHGDSLPQTLSARRLHTLDACMSTGMISSLLPIARISPSTSTTILSAVSRMRS